MANYVTTTSDKSKTTALLLCIFLGWMGAHYFYVGRIMRGIIALFTFNLFGIGWIYDTVKVALGGFKDNAGAPLRQ
ncbi:MAG: TM2 domain-containing protein [Lachnospiraceae bacterium]|nr:TM2 domain-containing protein [Lachnospiraceae bacterium]